MGLSRLIHSRPEVEPEMTVAKTVMLMAEAEIGAIAVKDGTRVAGIFTERDLVKRVVARGRDPGATLIRDVMTTNVVTVIESASAASAAAIMRSHRMRHLVVVDADGDYVGLVSQRHLLFDLMNDLVMKVNDFATYVMVDGPGG